MENTDGPKSKLFAYLSYRDGVKAIAWLQEAFGFDIVSKNVDETGKLVHSEIRLGDAVLMIGTNDKDYLMSPLKEMSTGQGLYIWVDSEEIIKELHRQAVAAGAKEVFPPEQTEWGTWRVRMLDPEGYEWSFGTYEPGKSW